MIDQAAWDRTVEISQGTKNLDGKTVLTKAADAESYTNDIVNAALAKLASDSSFDSKGSTTRGMVTVNAGGTTGLGSAAVIASRRRPAPRRRSVGRSVSQLRRDGRPARCCR